MDNTINRTIRTATIEDLEAVAAVEAACFPPAEAASMESFRERLEVYPGHFWLLEENRKLISFINGMVSNERLIRDEMFADASLHEEDGEWQMIFGVNTLPEYRRQGLASTVMAQVIADARTQGRKGLVLTCKEEKIHYYAGFGFVAEGKSQSQHGGAVWYDMRLTF